MNLLGKIYSYNTTLHLRALPFIHSPFPFFRATNPSKRVAHTRRWGHPPRAGDLLTFLIGCLVLLISASPANKSNWTKKSRHVNKTSSKHNLALIPVVTGFASLLVEFATPFSYFFTVIFSYNCQNSSFSVPSPRTQSPPSSYISSFEPLIFHVNCILFSPPQFMNVALLIHEWLGN